MYHDFKTNVIYNHSQHQELHEIRKKNLNTQTTYDILALVNDDAQRVFGGSILHDSNRWYT